MTIIEWTGELSVGIDSIDQQHRRIFNLINDVHSAILESIAQSSIADTLKELIDYTQTHFAYEEQLFAQTGYPESAAHQSSHVALTKKVLEYQQRYRAGEMILGIELLNFLKDWLVNHIIGTDKQYGPYLKERGIN